MTGILVSGGDCPPKSVLQKIIHADNLLAAADSGLIPLEEAGFRPHWIIGDMDSLGSPERLEKYPPASVIRYPADKDYTDTELALELLFEKGAAEVWIIGGGGGRIDHLFAIQSLFEREKAPSRWFIPGYELRLINRESSIGLPLQSPVSLFPLGGGPWNIKSRGLKWPLDRLPWARGFFSLSNENDAETVELDPLTGTFLLITPFH